MPRLTNSSPWQDDAIDWIHGQDLEVPAEPETKWHVARPSIEARAHALRVIREYASATLVPAALDITLDHGIEVDWKKDKKSLELEILSDGSIELSRCVDGNAVYEITLDEPDWRIREAFEWLGQS